MAMYQPYKNLVEYDNYGGFHIYGSINKDSGIYTEIFFGHILVQIVEGQEEWLWIGFNERLSYYSVTSQIDFFNQQFADEPNDGCLCSDCGGPGFSFKLFQ